jgi:translation initiation factor 2 alpha subunit (eIF-2alpha)
MGKHLNVDRWFDRMPGTNDLKMKRVSGEQEGQFPKKYRLYYQREGAVKFVSYLMQEEGISISEAWKRIKQMFND